MVQVKLRERDLEEMLKSQEEIKDIVDEKNHLELKLGEAKQELIQYEKHMAQSK